MRWSWPFSRAERDRGQQPGPSAAPADPAPIWYGAEPSRGEWRELPQLPRVTEAPALTSDIDFGASSAGQRGLPPVLQPLGRRQAPTALFGATTTGPGRATPDDREAASEPLTLPRQSRTVAEAPTGVVETSPGAALAGPSEATPSKPVSLPAVAVPRRLEARATPPGIGSTAGASAAQTPLTIVPSAQRAALQAAWAGPGRVVLSNHAAGPGTPPSSMASDHGVQASPPVLSAPRPAAAGSATGHPAVTLPALDVASRSRRPTLGESRRAGLGPPLERPGSLASAAPLATAAREMTAPPDQSASLVSPPVIEAAQSSVAKPIDAGGTARHLDAFATPASTVTRATPRMAQPRLEAPIRARRSSLSGVQRSSLDPGAPLPAGGPVRIDRSEAGAQAAAALRANSFTAGDTIVLPRSHGPIDDPRSQRLLAHELVHVGQQRRLGGDLPHEGTPAGQALEREARSAEPLADHQRRAALPLPASRASASSRMGAMPGAAAAGSDVHWAVDTALTLGAGKAGAGGPEAIGAAEPGMPQAAAAPIAAMQRQDRSSGTGGPAAPAGDTAGDEAELDDLARRLYDRLRYRLGRELLLDRERAGVLTDLR